MRIRWKGGSVEFMPIPAGAIRDCRSKYVLWKSPLSPHNGSHRLTTTSLNIGMEKVMFERESLGEKKTQSCDKSHKL